MPFTRAALIVLMLASLVASSASAGANLVWSKKVDGRARYVDHLDAGARVPSALDFYDGSVRSAISSTGTATPAPYTPAPLPDIPASSEMLTIESPSGSQVIVLQPDPKFGEDGFELPVPKAIRYDASGAPVATYEIVGDAGLVTDDGKVFVSFPSHHSSGPPVGEKDPRQLATVFNEQGGKVAEINDSQALFWLGELAPNGGLFIYPKQTDVLEARDKQGSLLFSHPIPGQILASRPGIAMTPDASRIAFQPRSASDAKASSVKVIDSTGQLVRSIDADRALRQLLLSGDGQVALLVSVDRVAAVSLTTGNTIWTRLVPANFDFTSAEISASGVTVVCRQLEALENYSPAQYPDQYVVEFVSATGATIDSVVIPRDDDPASGPPRETLDLRIADDAALALVASCHSVRLYALASN